MDFDKFLKDLFVYQGTSSPAYYASLLISLLISFAILRTWGDVFWYAPDEGVFVHMADRINKGEVYGVDFHGLQPGYHAYWNALLLQFFPKDFMVLRYPLIGLNLLCCVLMTIMFRRKGAFFAVLAGWWCACFGFVQFLNPSPNWYGAFFAVICIFVLSELPKVSLLRLVLVGFIAGLTLGIRHPTGIYLATGIVVYLLLEARNINGRDMSYLAKFILFLIIAGLLAICGFYKEPTALLCIALWPLLFAFALFFKLSAYNKDVFQRLFFFGIGGLSATIPYLLYQFMYGDIVAWLDTSVFQASHLFQGEWFFEWLYWKFPLQFLTAYQEHGHHIFLVFFVYSTVLYLLVPVSSLSVLYFAVKNIKTETYIHPVLIIPLFATYGMLYLQIPIYAYYAVFLCGPALFYMIERKSTLAVVTVIFSLCAYVSFSHFVAYPLDAKEKIYVRSDLNYVSLYVPEETEQRYKGVISYIHANTNPEDPIFVFPANPELYFLSDRVNPTPYSSTAHSVYTDEGYDRWFEMIAKIRPKVMISWPEDKHFQKYEKRFTKDIVEKLGYRRDKEIDHFVTYKRSDVP